MPDGLDMTAADLLAALATPWGRAAAVAGALMGLTMLALGLLPKPQRETIALWLMGAATEVSWHQSFTTLFDAVFGRRHLSLRCFAVSAFFSLLAAGGLWLVMGYAGLFALRAASELTLGEFLTLALVINVLADYVSLLETRWLLSLMPRARPWLAQAGILALDLVLTAAIIWLAIFAYLQSPLHEGEIETFAEILGVFSIFSVFFYSTFLTSVWTWAFIGSVGSCGSSSVSTSRSTSMSRASPSASCRSPSASSPSPAPSPSRRSSRVRRAAPAPPNAPSAPSSRAASALTSPP